MDKGPCKPGLLFSRTSPIVRQRRATGILQASTDVSSRLSAPWPVVALKPQSGLGWLPMLSLSQALIIGDNGQRRLEMVIGVAVILLFVVPVIVVAVYALVRPFTHIHYTHPSERLWRPLD